MMLPIEPDVKHQVASWLLYELLRLFRNNSY